MSAAEKLRALGVTAKDALEELSGDAGWAHAFQPGGEDAPDRAPDVNAVLDALPQIVAVVEAAERLTPFAQRVADPSGARAAFGGVVDPEIEAAAAALAALDEQLQDLGSPPGSETPTAP